MMNCLCLVDPFSSLNLPSRPKPAPKPKPKPLEIIPDEPRKLSDPAVKPMVRKLPQRKLSEVLPLTQPPTYDNHHQPELQKVI